MKPESIIHTVYLPERTDALLKQIACRDGVTVNDIMLDALDETLKLLEKENCNVGPQIDFGNRR